MWVPEDMGESPYQLCYDGAWDDENDSDRAVMPRSLAILGRKGN